MNCDGFRKVLSQTVASGEEPAGTAREHLNSCLSCKPHLEENVFFLVQSTQRSARWSHREIPRGFVQRLRPAAKAGTHWWRNGRPFSTTLHWSVEIVD